MSNIIGVRNNNTIVPYSAATKRTKEIDISSALVAGSGLNSLSVNIGKAIFYADSSGNWRMRFNIKVTADVINARITFGIAIANILSKNTSGFTQAIAGWCDVASVGIRVAYILPNSNELQIVTSTSPTAGNQQFYFSGDIELNIEPTTYTTAANMEGVTAVDVYIAPASATEVGLVTTGAQTFAGAKTFNSAPLADAIVEKTSTNGVQIEARTSGSAITSEYIGYTLTAAAIAVTTTAGSEDWANATNSLSLPAGNWMLYYTGSAGLANAPQTDKGVKLNFRIFNSTDNSTIASCSAAAYYLKDVSGNVYPGSSWTGNAACIGVVNLAATKTIYGQISNTLVSGDGTGNWTSVASTTAGLLAVRIA